MIDVQMLKRGIVEAARPEDKLDEEKMMTETADLIIAGAGLAGLLSLRHLSEKFPTWTIVLLEREEQIGGRLRASRDGNWSCGLQGIGADLFDYISPLLAPDAAGKVGRIQRAGVMTAQKLSDLPFTQLSAAEMARALGGAAAARDWATVEELFATTHTASDGPDQAFSHLWKGDRKSGALIVLEHLARLWGFPELGPAPGRSVIARALQFRRGQWTGPWDELLRPWLDAHQEQVTVACGSQIMAARYEAKMWTVAGTRGSFQAPRLLVAQSPWEAIAWLPKEYWPNSLLNLSSKSKAVSLLTLSDTIAAPSAALPEVVLIPAEDVQVISQGKELVYQATLNFELTVQAPAVVKAVKRLKRAKKKLHLALPELGAAGENDHIALLPVGWAHAASPQEQRWFEKVDPQAIQKPHLGFCGDSYGGEADTDLNLIASVEALRRVWT